MNLIQSIRLSQRAEIILQIIDDRSRRESISTIGGDAGLSGELVRVPEDASYIKEQ